MNLFKKPLTKLNSFNCEVKVRNDEKESRLQLESEFYKANRSFLIISQILISAPIGIHKPRRDTLQRDLTLCRLDLVLCLSVYASFAFCIYHEFTFSDAEVPIEQKPLYSCEYIIYLIHLMELIRIITCWREGFWKFHKFILDVDRTLFDMKVHIRYNDMQRFSRQHMTLILLHFLICMTISYFYANGKITDILRSCIVYLLPNAILNFSLLQYYVLLFIVYKRGEKLYVLLERLLNTSSFNNDIWNLRQQIHLIRSLYAKLDKFTGRVNGHFSISICLAYLGTFTNFSINLFFLYKHFKDWDLTQLSWLVYSLIWLCMHIAKVFLILYYNQKVQNMKTKTSLLLSSFEFEYPGAETTIRLFILQLMSDTRTDYTCSMIALNMKFATSFSVAISTLFIYLVQYDITYEALWSTPYFATPTQNNKQN